MELMTQGAQESGTGGRLVPLDVLRAVAVLLVLGRHMPLPASAGDGAVSWAETALRIWQRGGWIGVDVFFVLSGFLVSGLLFREYRQHGRLRVKRFLIRRGFKIYPAFYLMIAWTVVYLLARGGRPRLPALLCEVFFVQNYGPGLWAHTWSLAVEEHFYFGLAGLFVYLFRRGGAEPLAVVPRIAAGLMAGCLLLRLLNAKLFPHYLHQTHLFPTALRIDALFFGVLLAYGYHFHGPAFQAYCRRYRLALLLAGVALLLPPFIWALGSTMFLHTVGLSLLSLGSGMILCGLMAGTLAHGPTARAIARVGAYSYSIYLWHLPVTDLIRRSVPPWGGGWVNVPLCLVASLVVGIVLARLVEIPALRLRDRLYPSSSGALR